MAESTDAVVVGAGVIGSSIGLELARSGLRVVVVDKFGGAGNGSTSASSAVVRFTYPTIAASKPLGSPVTAGKHGATISKHPPVNPSRRSTAAASPCWTWTSHPPECSRDTSTRSVFRTRNGVHESCPGGCLPWTQAGTSRPAPWTTRSSSPTRPAGLIHGHSPRLTPTAEPGFPVEEDGLGVVPDGPVQVWRAGVGQPHALCEAAPVNPAAHHGDASGAGPQGRPDHSTR